MGIMQNIRGIVGTLFVIGKDENVALKANSSVIETKNGADNAFVSLRTKQLQNGFGINDVPVALDLKGSIPLIEFAFDGASVPSAGSNTNKFGFCHTTGGSYTNGDVVYDDGTTMYKLQAVSAIMTALAVSGGISLIENGLYSKAGATFVLKGDGSGSSTGNDKVIALSLAHNSGGTVSSTTSIPEGAIITRVEVVVSTLFNGTSPTVAITVAGSSPLTVMTTSENNLKLANQYQNLACTYVDTDNAGVVTATYTASASSAGVAKIYVFYATPLA